MSDIPESQPNPEGGEIPADFQASYRAAERAEAKLRTLVAGLSAALVATIFVGAFLLYQRGSGMYTAAEFEPHVAAQQERLIPQVTASLNEVAVAAKPVYVAALRNMAEDSWPELRAALAEQVRILATTIRRFGDDEVAAVLGRVQGREQARLAAAFPSLSDEERLRLFSERWTQTIGADIKLQLAEFDRKCKIQISHVRDQLVRFDTSAYESLEREVLMRRYVHLWLQLLDQQFILADQAEEG